MMPPTDREQLASLFFGSIPWRRFLDREGWDAYYDFHSLRARLGSAVTVPLCGTDEERRSAGAQMDHRLTIVGRLRDTGIEPEGIELVVLTTSRRYLRAVSAAQARFTHWLQEDV